MSTAPDANVGLVLTGGGARGAYQAGALEAIAEITGARELPFRVLSGSSAGSINVVHLASRAESFRTATRDLCAIWIGLRSSQVFRTGPATVMKTATEWIADLGLGGWIGTGRGRSLLDTAPLRELVEAKLDVHALHHHVVRGDVHGIAVTATNYESGLGVSFFEGDASIAPWSRVTRIGERAHIRHEHVLASAAIPLFFPAVEIESEWYADGSLRLSTPLSPVIHMGARKILAIAVRHAACGEPHTHVRPSGYPSTAETAGVLLNALFLDALESDVERATRINQTLALLPPGMIAARRTQLAPLEILVLRPSIDLAALVLETLKHFPATVRHLFRGLGASDTAGWDLLSYLAFEHQYTRRLVDLGHQDTVGRADEIREFLRS